MLKKITLIISWGLIILFLGCKRDSSIVNPIVSTSGVFVLCEGTISIPGDFSFINTNNDSVYNNVYSNSNNGASLGIFPDGIYLYGEIGIFISIQGQYNGPGKMINIDYNSYKLRDTSANFGDNPYNFDLDNGAFFVTNVAGSTVSEIDIGKLQLVNTFDVGINPSEIVHANQNCYVVKASYTTENSLALISDFGSHLVTKIYFPAPPVSVCFAGPYGMFVSGYTTKKIYQMGDSITPGRITDSVFINISGIAAIGEVVAGDEGFLYIVGINTGSYYGNSVHKYEIVSELLDQNFTPIQMPSNHDIYGIAYDNVNKIIYIGDSQSGQLNGIVWAFSANGSQLKQYQLAEKYPAHFAFKYQTN